MEWRKLHARIIESESFHGLPDDYCRLTWILLTLCLDSAGRIPNRPALLRSKLYPLREDVSAERVAAAVDALAEAGMIRLYAVEGRAYLQAVNWHTYQSTSREAASHYPAPPVAASEAPDQLRSESGGTPDPVQNGSCSEQIPERRDPQREQDAGETGGGEAGVDARAGSAGWADGQTGEDAPSQEPPATHEDYVLNRLVDAVCGRFYRADADAVIERLDEAIADHGASSAEKAYEEAIEALLNNRPRDPLAYFWQCFQNALGGSAGRALRGSAPSKRGHGWRRR